MNLPNQLSFLRLFLSGVLFFLIPAPGLGAKTASFFIFIFASLTDYYDGKIARAQNLITPLGRFIDPIADKTLTFSAVFGFYWMNLIPLWMVAAIVARDLVITGLRLLMPQESKAIGAQASGKHKTVIQFSAIILILLYMVVREMSFWDAAWTGHSLLIVYYTMFFVVINTIYSGAIYVWVNRHNFTGRSSR